MDDTPLPRAAHDFIWKVMEIQSQLEDMQQCWATLLSVTKPQWLILMAIAELETRTKGVAGVDVAAKLRVHSSFVAAQTKQLETKGLLMRKQASDDARYTLMSLTARAEKELAKLAQSRAETNVIFFKDVDEATLSTVNVVLSTIAKNARLAARLLEIDTR